MLSLPSAKCAARSRSAAAFWRDTPAERIASSSMASTSAGSGKKPDTASSAVAPSRNSATKRPRIVLAALPLSCWKMIERASAWNAVGDGSRSRGGPTASITIAITSSDWRRCATARSASIVAATGGR